VTGSWDEFQTTDLGRVQIQRPGNLEVKVRPKDKPTWKAINLNSVRLTPAEPSPPAAAHLLQ
jgi:hypothetical protein